MKLADTAAHFIREREIARKNNDAGKPRPLCDDEIIRTYRFCNIRREDDKVTRWIKKYWRDPHAGHKNMMPALLLARMVNWPPTLARMGFPDVWDEKHIIDSIHAQAAEGKAWTGAYTITTCGASMDKALYVVGTVCRPLVGGQYNPRPEDTLEAVWTRLRYVDGLGAGFIAAQVIADLKYIDPYLKDAPDWGTWAAPGPGSRRGINRYYDLPLEKKLGDEEWLAMLHQMAKEVGPKVPIKLHAQDWQNVMCEFDKYMRVKLGEGRPRSLYKPDKSYVV